MRTDDTNNAGPVSGLDKEYNFNDIDSLIIKLKEKDTNYKKIYRRFSVIMFVMVFVYLALMVVNPDPELTIPNRISGACYVLAFLVGGYLFRKEFHSIERIDYTEPVMVVLKNALTRYRLFRKSFFYYLLVPLFVNIGLCFSGPLYHIPGDWAPLNRIIILQVIYWGIMMIAFFIGYLVWRKESKPYYDLIKGMIRELNSTNEDKNVL